MLEEASGGEEWERKRRAAGDGGAAEEGEKEGERDEGSRGEKVKERPGPCSEQGLRCMRK